MKLVKDDIVVIENNPNCVSVWKRYGFVEAEENELTYQELKSLAKEKGINTQGMKKDEILEALGM